MLYDESCVYSLSACTLFPERSAAQWPLSAVHDLLSPGAAVLAGNTNISPVVLKAYLHGLVAGYDS